MTKWDPTYLFQVSPRIVPWLAPNLKWLFLASNASGIWGKAFKRSFLQWGLTRRRQRWPQTQRNASGKTKRVGANLGSHIAVLWKMTRKMLAAGFKVPHAGGLNLWNPFIKNFILSRILNFSTLLKIGKSSVMITFIVHL